MKYLSKIFNLLLNLLIVLVSICLVFGIYSFICLKIVKKDYVNYFGYTYFEILTGSMEDEINVDDYVFVKLTDDVKKDDIISYIKDGNVVTHRIVKIDDKEIVTRGDANNIDDDPISKNQVIGKVIHVGRNYGKYVKVATEPIVLITFFATLILFSIAFSNSKERSIVDEDIEQKIS